MKVALHTLGCKVNQYESEAISAMFRSEGHQIVDEKEFADVYIINTCTVTAVADKKSRQFIRRMKKVNPESIIVVTGCYAQINPEEVTAVEGVDIVAGTNEKSMIPCYVAEFMENHVKQLHVKDYDELKTYENMGEPTEAMDRTRAYIKIQEGCNRFCSYCVIPYARGSVRSRPLEQIVEEAGLLVEKGYREIVLTGINTALYEMEDAESKKESGELYGVEKVIAALDDIPGDFRIRLSSLEPAVVDAEYVKGLLKYRKLCHHLHLSAQSGSDKVLSLMNRPYEKKSYYEIVRVLREFDPYYGISTDIIVGFPGEKEVDFESSCELVRKCEFCKTHIFSYSKRPFTKAASMQNHVAPQVKNRRKDKLNGIAKAAATDFFQKNIGRMQRVLLEEYHVDKGAVAGYGDNYIRVYIECDVRKVESMINTFVDVELTGIYMDGMKGRICNYNDQNI